MVFERIIYKQITIYMHDKLSKHITGFLKPHGTQHSLITILEKWKSALDKGENISKAFDTINHNLLPAKLKTNGLSINVLDLMRSYLKNPDSLYK